MCHVAAIHAVTAAHLLLTLLPGVLFPGFIFSKISQIKPMYLHDMIAMSTVPGARCSQAIPWFFLSCSLDPDMAVSFAGAFQEYCECSTESVNHSKEISTPLKFA